MTTSKEQEEFRRNPKLWMVSAVKWVLENPDYKYELMGGIEIKDAAWEGDSTKGLEDIEAPDLEAAVAAGHALIDKYAREAGDLGFEIWFMAPRHPYPEQEQLGVPHYKLSAEARKQARAIGMRGGDLEARIARMVRHAVSFDHKVANMRYRGIAIRVEERTVTWIGLAVPARRPGRPRTRKAR
jgi:hypothetical protein